MNNEIYPKERELDGIFYRVMRDGKSCSLCFTDLTEQEQTEVLDDYEKDSLLRMCMILAGRLRTVGDQFGII